jgi:hypothetical protein
LRRFASPLAPEPEGMGRGAADWRNKAIAPYKCAQQNPSPAPPMLRGSCTLITAVREIETREV